MSKRILTITDCTDVAANELRAVLVTSLDKLESDVVVEPIVNVNEFSVLHGSFVARLLAESYEPSDLTILSVVNPLNTASNKRARIAGRLKNGIKIVGANTGVFTWLINDFGLDEVCETNQAGLKGDGFISFGGKYIHAPIAAKLAATNNIDSVKVGDFSADGLVTLDYPQGVIVHVDNFGVPKLYWRADELSAKQGDKFELYANGRSLGEATFCHSMKELHDGELGLYEGSSLGLLEIGIVRQLNTAGTLGVECGDIVQINPVD